MAVEIYPGPGTSAWQSTRFAATVNGVPAYVYGYTRTAALPSVAWAAGNLVEASWLRFSSDETVTIAVARLAGPITSWVAYPSDAVTGTLVGGVLLLTVLPDRRVRVELNGDRRHTLRILGGPIQPAVGAATDWAAYGPRVVTGLATGSDLFSFASAHGFAANDRVRIVSSTGALPTAVGGDLSDDVFYYVVADTPTTLRLSRTPGGAAIDVTSIGGGVLTIYRTTWPTAATLTFPPGVHRIGRLFAPANGSRLHLQGGAVVIGSIDVRGLQGVTVTGPGVLSGTFSTHEVAQSIADFNVRGTYSMFYGNDGVNFYHDNAVSGITVVAQPFYLVFDGVWSWRNVSAICPWTFECDGFDFSGRTPGDRRGEVVGCYAEHGDDAVKVTSEFANTYLADSFIVGCANSCIHFSYWNQPGIDDDSPYKALVENVDCLHLGIADTRNPGNLYPTLGGTAVFKAWVDGFESEAAFGRHDVAIRNLRVWGPHAGVGMMLENRLYPFEPSLQRGRYGQVQDWDIDGLWFQFAPGQGHRMRGRDLFNGPRDIRIRGFVQAGVPVTAHNWTQFVDTAFVQNIYIEGRLLVTNEDVCNQALSHIGDAAVVTSVSPPDGSAQSLLCAQFLPVAVHDLQELHNWSFATRRAELVAVDGEDQAPWAHCYELPSGMLRLLGIAQAGGWDDYETQYPVGRYEMIQNEDGVVRIYSDVPSAHARFTVLVPEPSAWSPLFRNAVSWHLASLLAGPIIKGEMGAGESKRCMQMANAFLSRAASSDANQRKVSQHTQTKAPWIRARGGLGRANLERGY